ncbi:XS domain-containing protein [Klebsormidium nitens]|uniref:XS domain-containing protein n=1 Tax=Klebsormidium nitens TaxID=105231 RepID=A0A1Y1HJ34_KLENI|nr:XS domain-containing protein [Klebsormidium nitens]|eukprot:GAQ78530.1 XS domain-containing protein [Klebsormidium nitens]
MKQVGPPYQQHPDVGAGSIAQPACNEDQSSFRGAQFAYLPHFVPSNPYPNSQVGNEGTAYRPDGLHSQPSQWGKRALPPGAIGAPGLAPRYGAPQLAGNGWANDGHGWNGASISGADVSGHQPSWGFRDHQPQNAGLSEPRFGYGFVSGSVRDKIKLEPKAEPEFVSSRNGGSANCSSVRGEVPSDVKQVQGDFNTGASDRKTGSQFQSDWREKGDFQNETKSPKSETLGAQDLPNSSYNRTYAPHFRQGNKSTGGLGVNGDTKGNHDMFITSANRDKKLDPARVSNRALVVSAQNRDIAERAASDEEMDLDFSGGASGSDDEGGSKESFNIAVKSWKDKALTAGGGSKNLVESRRDLPCLVCRKFSNTVQVYQDFRALLQHAETHRKLEPFQHAAYSAALRQIESEAEGNGNELVPAKKKLKVLEPPEKVWPPVVVVENLRTGTKGGKWDGVSEREIKKAFGDQGPIRKVTEKWRGDGHTGVVLLHFEETCYGYDRAQEMGECWRAKGQGRDDWEKLRPPRKRYGESVESEHATWQRYMRRLVEEDGSRRLFCYLATVADMERFEGKEKGKRWQPISGEELEARRKREKSAVLEGNLEHAKTRLANQELKQRNAELTSAMQEKEVELQAVRMERAHLNEQHEQWVRERLARSEQVHLEEKRAAQKRADEEKAALEARLEEMHRARREDHKAMAELKSGAESRERQLRHVFETGLKAIDAEYNDKEKVLVTRTEEHLRQERERLQAEKEAATRNLLAEQREKMEEIERERARAQEMMEEAKKLYDAQKMREKDGQEEVDERNECGICLEDFGDELKRAVMACGHAKYCKACSEAYLKLQKPPYKCPVGHKLRNKMALELCL